MPIKQKLEGCQTITENKCCGCNIVHYCSQEYLRLDRTNHKAFCKIHQHKIKYKQKYLQYKFT